MVQSTRIEQERTFQDNLWLHIRARYTALYLESGEEDRIIEEIHALARHFNETFHAAIEKGTEMKMAVRTWDCAKGLDGSGEKTSPVEALDALLEMNAKARCIFVMKDLHPFMGDQEVVRHFKNVAHALRERLQTIVIIAPVMKIPPELEEEITLIDYDLPTREQIDKIIQDSFSRNPQKQLSPGSGTNEKPVDALMIGDEVNRPVMSLMSSAFQGLSAARIRQILAKAIALKGNVDEDDIDLIIEEKRQIIKRSGILEFIDAPETLDDVGGHELLKEYIRIQKKSFEEGARAYGIPMPKGVLLVGVPGAGKSLIAKAIANELRVPLLRLDLGKVYGSLVGDSEARIRQAIKIAESCSPCVLNIEELEKSISGGTGHQGDGGVGARVLSTLLVWLAEKTKPVYVTATANDTNMPAALIRSGRFDQVFYVGLPTLQERKKIFEIHLKRKRDMGFRNFDILSLAKQTEDYSGAEIESCIIEAMRKAYAQEREFDDRDIQSCIQETPPLSRTMKETIDRLNAWADSGRARRSSDTSDLPGYQERKGENEPLGVSEVFVDNAQLPLGEGKE